MDTVDSENEKAILPVLRSSDYYTRPTLEEIADGGYSGRVPDFVVGRVGYGEVRFLGETDVRCLDLEELVKFYRNAVAVYEDESKKPPIGHGLNKPAEVTLFLKLGLVGADGLVSRLRSGCERQGASFVSFDPCHGEWRFLVQHFSRFGLVEEEEEDDDDVAMNDAVVRPPVIDEMEEEPQVGPSAHVLSHSLPAHLGLDPVKMQEMRMLMFSADEESEDFDGPVRMEKGYFGQDYVRSDSPRSSAKSPVRSRPPLQGSARKTSSRMSPLRKSPQALLEYNANVSEVSPPRNILMTGQKKGLPVKTTKAIGFKLDLKHETPLSGCYSGNIVDAGLFMGRSFRVGWGPNGILVHTGTPVGKSGYGLSSVINVEKVAIDRAVRDENNMLKDELVDLCFASPLNLHKSLDHESREVEVGSFKLKLQKLVANRFTLSEICRAFIRVVERQLDVPGLSTSMRVILMHQVTIWELIRVLFSERETAGQSKSLIGVDDDDGEEDMMLDKKDESLDIDPEASPFVRRAEFSYWLQESVCHRVQEEVGCLSESSILEHILLLLTGRQLETAVELAASRGDVRLAILLSQAGGSMVHRSDMAHQLDLWRINGLDFSYVESDRLRIFELLSGNIQVAFSDSSIDWKRYLGLVMWYHLQPDTSLPVSIHTYQQLVNEGRAPYPVPVYIDEGPLDEAVNWNAGDRFDIAYYLMLLHANHKDFGHLKTMFSAFSSTYDPLDYHMVWHQRAILEAIGTFSAIDLHVLDMSLISQLLCLGQCHWAIYVAIHMSYHDDFPFLHASLIREILFQYCETWSTQAIQQQFIEDLGIPSAWMHEALAIYFQYYGDLAKALEHFLECANWQKAHSIFMTSVAHSLFSSSKHSEIWRLASSMEVHKSEIADWDLGAGIFIDFFTIRSSLQEENIMVELDALEKKNDACRSFFNRLNESLVVWGSKLPVDARAAYSKMAEELCKLLVCVPGEGSTPAVQMSCFDTMLSAPIPQDQRSGHLQDALSVFTYILSGTAAS